MVKASTANELSLLIFFGLINGTSILCLIAKLFSFFESVLKIILSNIFDFFSAQKYKQLKVCRENFYDFCLAIFSNPV